MKQFLNSRYFKSLVITILILAGIHVGSLVIYTIRTGRYEALNIFNVEGVGLLAPELGKGLPNFILSLVLLIGLYIAVFIGLI